MLNGFAPLILFHFPNATVGASTRAQEYFPDPEDQAPTIKPNVEIAFEESEAVIIEASPLFIRARGAPPIPIYLDPDLTGIHVDTESKNVDLDTQTEGKISGTAPIVDQLGLNSSVSISMVARKDSIVLGVFLALMDMAFDRLVNKDYTISYFNGPTTLIGGILNGISVNQDANTDLMNIDLSISKVNLAVTGAPAAQGELKATMGALPTEAL